MPKSNQSKKSPSSEVRPANPDSRRSRHNSRSSRSSSNSSNTQKSKRATTTGVVTTSRPRTKTKSVDTDGNDRNIFQQCIPVLIKQLLKIAKPTKYSGNTVTRDFITVTHMLEDTTVSAQAQTTPLATSTKPLKTLRGTFDQTPSAMTTLDACNKFFFDYKIIESGHDVIKGKKIKGQKKKSPDEPSTPATAIFTIKPLLRNLNYALIGIDRQYTSLKISHNPKDGRDINTFGMGFIPLSLDIHNSDFEFDTTNGKAVITFTPVYKIPQEKSLFYKASKALTITPETTLDDIQQYYKEVRTRLLKHNLQNEAGFESIATAQGGSTTNNIPSSDCKDKQSNRTFETNEHKDQANPQFKESKVDEPPNNRTHLLSGRQSIYYTNRQPSDSIITINSTEPKSLQHTEDQSKAKADCCVIL